MLNSRILSKLYQGTNGAIWGTVAIICYIRAQIKGETMQIAKDNKGRGGQAWPKSNDKVVCTLVQDWTDWFCFFSALIFFKFLAFYGQCGSNSRQSVVQLVVLVPPTNQWERSGCQWALLPFLTPMATQQTTTTNSSFVLKKYSRSYPISSDNETTAAESWQHFVNPVIKTLVDVQKSSKGDYTSFRLRIIWLWVGGNDDMATNEREVVFVCVSSSSWSVIVWFYFNACLFTRRI